MSYQLIQGVPVWGLPQDNAVEQIVNCSRDAFACALMADHHLGYAVPIGGVVAYREHVSPSGVGYDISCGNKAVELDIPADELRKRIGPIMDDIFHTISFGVGMKNRERVEHTLFQDDPAWEIPAAARLKELARNQLGTVGSGNHYVDLFVDERDHVWCGVHFGSRGLGHKLATHYIREGGGQDGINVDPVLLQADSELGREYVACMKLAGRYAYAGREWVCEKVAGLLGAKVLDEVHNHHNFAWEEEHAGESLWVVRKGATPAFPGQRGFVGGSMGDISVILEGVDGDESRLSLYSTVHGAGRVMSRTRARGKIKRRKGRVVKVTEGEVSSQMMLDWVRSKHVELRGGGTDESPHCYKRLPDVLGFHSASTRILHTLKPLGVAMAGEHVHDPFRD